MGIDAYLRPISAHSTSVHISLPAASQSSRRHPCAASVKVSGESPVPTPSMTMNASTLGVAAMYGSQKLRSSVGEAFRQPVSFASRQL